VDSSDLIDALARDLPSVSPARTRRDLLLGLSCGTLISFALTLLIYGMRPGLLSLERGGPMLLKAGYALTLAGIAGSVLMPLLRPGSVVPDRRGWLALVMVALAGLAVEQIATVSGAGIVALWIGVGSYRCPLRVAGLSLPIFAGLCWAIRRQAPTRLRLAGATAGLVSGGVAASLYALACTRDAAGFVLIWYTLGIAVCTTIGALLGPRLLRW
jgi:hypothetical protein